MSYLWHVQLFGGLQARRGDRVVARFPTRQTGLLLARLALSPRRHRRDELSDLLWPDADLDAGRTRLRTALAALRRQLEPPGGEVVTAGAGAVFVSDRDHVGLRSDTVAVDAAQFTAMLRRAESLTPGTERTALLAAAFALYEGELLAGYDEDWIVGERERLARLYDMTARYLVAAREAAGDAGGALDAARRAVEVDPLLESAHAAVIRLLVARGEPEAARQQFETLTRRLREELDADPAPATRALLGGVADVRPAPAPQPAAPSGPVPSPAFPRPPQPLTRFFGRADELARLSDWLTDPAVRLVTVTGPGGTGKTRLALEFARRAEAHWGGAVAFVAAASLSESDRLWEALVDALGLPRRGDGDPLERARAALDGRPALLLLDNLEQLADAAAPDLEGLLTSLPLLSCVVTSRQRLDLPGERELFLETLPVPLPGESARLTPAALAGFAGVRLFVDRAQSARPDFALTPRNAGSVAALCARLEGVPLALELAAAWARMLSPAQMRARLDDKFPLLVSRRPDGPARHSSLWAAIDGSYRALPAPLKRLFVRLSVFRGGWTEESAESVCGEPLALEMLDRLRARSLLSTREDGDVVRYGMLETLREFAGERLTPAEGSALSERHAGHFGDLAERADAALTGPDQAAWLDRLETEHDNLRAALAWWEHRVEAGNAEAADAGLRLAGALGRFWFVRGHLSEGRQWLARALARAPSAGAAPSDPSARARAARAAGVLAMQQGEYAAARAWLEEGLALRRQMGDVGGVADSLINLGVVAYHLGEYPATRALWEESLALRRQLGDPKGIADSLSNLGVLVMQQGEYPAARALHEESLALRRRLGDLGGVGGSLINLGVVAFSLGEYPAARVLYEETLALMRQLGDTRGVALSLNNLGATAREQGEYAEARALHGESLALRRQMGDLLGVAEALQNVSAVVQEQQQPARSVRLLGAMDALRAALGAPLPPGEQADVDQRLAAARGDLGEAAFASAWDAGRAMTLEQAVEYALADAG